MTDKQTLKVASLYAVAIGGTFLMMALLAWPAKALLGQAGPSVLMAACVAWGLVFVRLAWKHTDETAREAHKFAAVWGGPGGLVAVMVGLPIVATTVFGVNILPGLEHLGDSPWGLVMGGVILSALAQTLGYFVAWAGWWMRRR